MKQDSIKTISIELNDYNIGKVNPHWWGQIMSLFLKPGLEFEIRHWREENEVVEKAFAYGTVSEIDSTDFEVSIKGTLTNSTINKILNNALCLDNHMTEFFTINVIGVVSSSHYGREIYIFNPSNEICNQIYTLLEPIKQYFNLGEDYE